MIRSRRAAYDANLACFFRVAVVTPSIITARASFICRAKLRLSLAQSLPHGSRAHRPHYVAPGLRNFVVVLISCQALVVRDVASRMHWDTFWRRQFGHISHVSGKEFGFCIDGHRDPKNFCFGKSCNLHRCLVVTRLGIQVVRIRLRLSPGRGVVARLHWNEQTARTARGHEIVKREVLRHPLDYKALVAQQLTCADFTETRKFILFSSARHSFSNFSLWRAAAWVNSGDERCCEALRGRCD